MSIFTNLEKTRGIFTYDRLRDALYSINLPMDEQEVDEIYEQYVQNQVLPDFLIDYFDSHSAYYED